MAKVLIAPTTLAECGGPFVELLQGAGFQLSYSPHHTQMTEEELLHTLAGAAAAIAGSEPYTRRVMEANPQLRVIARAGVGYDAVDLEAATEHGVAVTIAPGTNQDAVAEHTFTLILALAKGLVPQHLAVRMGRWPRSATLPLRGRTLGIAGLGRIGKAVALRGECFKMRLLAYEPYPDRRFAAEHNVKLVSFEQLLAESDFLTLHVPLTPDSKQVINRTTLEQMRPGAFLINTARGGLVNEADLAQALRDKRLAGAALDVFEKEPPDKDNPLFGLDSVLLTPHAAGVDLQSRDDMAASAARSIIALYRGQWPAEQVVNSAVRSRFKW